MQRLAFQLARTPAPRLRAIPLWFYVILVFVASILLAPTSAGGRQDNAAPVPVSDLVSLEQAFQGIVDRVSPSVVAIRAQRRYAALLPGKDSTSDTEKLEQLVVVNGSGSVIRADGMILTNEHVVQSAGEIEVFFSDGRKQTAHVVAADPRSDLAILQVDRHGLQPVKLSQWDNVARGQWTITLGNPYGLGNDGKLSVSVGVISNLGRRLPGLGEVDDRLYNDMIQTTAAINPGNSGGPLFNIKGELIGIVTAMHTRAAADEGVGFAIPLTPAKQRLIDRLLAARQIEYGYLGISVAAPDIDTRHATGIGPDVGAVVEDVELDGPAAKAGVQIGDVILRFNSRIVRGPTHLAELLAEAPVGRSVPLELRRGREKLTATATVAKREISRVGWMRGDALLWRGMRLATLTPASRERMQVDAQATGVVVIDVAQGSPAQRAGIQIGDVIEQVSGQSVNNIGALRQTARTHEGPVKISLRHRGTRTLPP